MVTNTPDNTVSVLGQSGRYLPARLIYQVGTEPPFVAVADFNGDRIADLAATNFGDDTVGILLGRGRYLPAPADVPVGMGPVGVRIAVSMETVLPT